MWFRDEDGASNDLELQLSALINFRRPIAGSSSRHQTHWPMHDARKSCPNALHWTFPRLSAALYLARIPTCSESVDEEAHMDLIEHARGGYVREQSKSDGSLTSRTLPPLSVQLNQSQIITVLSSYPASGFSRTVYLLPFQKIPPRCS